MQVAVVTGATDGIGKETAINLLKQGYIVYFTGRSEKKVNHLTNYLNNNAIPFILDVKNSRHINNLYKHIENYFGRVDILINNAGIYIDKIDKCEPDKNLFNNSLEFDADLFCETLNVNLVGCYRTIQRLLPFMIKHNYGRIVNVSSGMGRFYKINDKGMFYKISKLSLNALTFAISKSVNSYNILINSVCPGWVKTNMGGIQAMRSVEQAVEGIIWAATLQEGGPNGMFFRDTRPLSFL